MKILFLFPQIPYPPHSGGRIVTWNTLKRFASECSVRVACLYHHPAELPALDEVKKIAGEAAAFPAHGKWDKLPLLRSLVSAWPYKAHRFWNPDLAAYIQRLQARDPVDVIHAQNFYTTPYVTGREACLKIHYKENVEGNLLLRYGQRAGSRLTRWAALVEGRRTRRFEMAACRKFDQVLTISPVDRDSLLALDPALPVRHQRPGVDLGAYPFLDIPPEPPAVLFTGTMSYYPNEIGIRWFLETIWPRVRRQIENAECWIVGAAPPPAVRAWDGRDGVRVTGRVESITEYLWRAWIYIVPLTVGGGIRLKILEAMASGRPIVSTSIGCEGLEGRHGEHWRVEDEPEGFAHSIVDLIQNPWKAEQLSVNARRLAEAVYDWDQVIPQQVELYRTLRKSLLSLRPPGAEASRPAWE